MSPFVDNSINIAFPRRCIQHVAGDQKVFQEVNRVLTPNEITNIKVSSITNAIISCLIG
ncbi:MAG: hypothetical protein GX799_05930 [Crenarchaeota archaeon]|nr:hypothetical protein [Thermoproteota archaeon]